MSNKKADERLHYEIILQPSKHRKKCQKQNMQFLASFEVSQQSPRHYIYLMSRKSIVKIGNQSAKTETKTITKTNTYFIV